MLNNFIPFPILTTERLVLRQIEPEDASIIFDLRTNEIVNRFLLRPDPETFENILNIIEKLNQGIAEKQHIYWVLNLKPDRKVIGTICLWNFSEENLCAEIGYELHPDFQKKGLMQEAIKKVLEYGFVEMSLKSIVAWTNQENSASIKLLERNGFVRNPLVESAINAEPDGEITISYSLTKKMFI